MPLQGRRLGTLVPSLKTSFRAVQLDSSARPLRRGRHARRDGAKSRQLKPPGVASMELKRVHVLCSKRESTRVHEPGTRACACWGKGTEPGRAPVGAGCDARVLGLHAAHVGGVQEGSAVPRSGQRWRDVGRRHLVFNIRLASRMPSRQRYTSCMVPLRRSQRVRTDRANIRLLTPRKSPARTYKVCTALSAPERHMCSRVLGDREWSRPGRVSARHTSAITLPGEGMCLLHFRA